MDIELAAALLPYVTAAIGRYGGEVVPHARDARRDSATDSTVEVGRRLLRRIVTAERSGAVRSAVEELAVNPADDERVATLRLRLRAAVTADPALARAVAEILTAAGVMVSTPGDRSVVVRTVSDVQTGEWPVIRPS